MTLLLIIGIASLFLGFLIGYLIKRTKIQSKSQELEQEENQIKLRIKDLEKDYVQKHAELEKQYTEASESCVQALEKQNKELSESFINFSTKIQQERENWNKEKNQKMITWSQREADLKAEVSSLESQISEKKQTIQLLTEQTNTTIKEVTEKSFDAAVSQYENNISAEEQKYLNATQEAKNNYYEMIHEFEEIYLKSYDDYEIKMDELNTQIQNARSVAAAAIEANRRAALEKQEKDFYRLQLSELDIKEIETIRSIEPYLRQKEPLNKVIWKVYYEKPYTNLIGRVVGQGVKTGIYKITNMENGMCYIGQAVNIAERWKQHIKRGIGADQPTQNKLYPAMLSSGVENFTFEILEECPANKLTEQEKYWTDFYQAQSFGYVVRKG